ncbi:selenium metabolism membrane protein YedE/FdhT [Bacillus sp. EB600]|uniref:selenium metabolism membrane protein YedE/FdhT n=1 Tax=Bacillus sp. EB600 TaxID=2806345 RepID=UPI00210962B8|nr:selenium metabolism membrane protein YedE/FdhT [Bacillus sp. EB600]MCQ6278605.1 selenium metabolism membrane protein YedE/FdhT [Bacillus sp. EB600]
MIAFLERIQERFFNRFWNPFIVLVFAGVFAAFYFGLTGTLWAVTGEFTRWGGNFLQLFGVDTSKWAYFNAIKLKGEPINRTDGWLVMGMLLGGLFSALISQNFKWKVPRQKRRWVWGFVGGALAGFGTRLAMGCNLAAFFTGVPQFSLHAWFFIAGTALGTYIGVKLAVLPIFKGKPKVEFGIRPAKVSSSTIQPNRRQLYAAAVVFGVLVLIAIYYISSGQPMLGLAALFGAVFGMLIQRGQICFTSGLRDLWLTGRGTMAKAIIIGMAIQTVGTAIFIYKGAQPVIHWASLGSLLGGVMFGVGIVIAGGCETGWMYRLMEGQVQFIAVGIGNIVGATILAYGWDHWGIFNVLVKGAPEVNLITSLGWSGALFVTGALLVILYLLVVWKENSYTKKIARRSTPASKKTTA